MRNLDPDKPSPIVGAIATMLSNQRLTERDAEDLAVAVRRASHVHESWCDDHGSDHEGEHCTRHVTSFALYENEERDWGVWAMAYKGRGPEVIIDVPVRAGSHGASLSPESAFAILAALEHNPDTFTRALEQTAAAIIGDRAERTARAVANDAALTAAAEEAQR